MKAAGCSWSSVGPKHTEPGTPVCHQAGECWCCAAEGGSHVAGDSSETNGETDPQEKFLSRGTRVRAVLSRGSG